MRWHIEYSKEALKFIRKHNIHKHIREEIRKLLLRTKGEKINIDIKKLEGQMEGLLSYKKREIQNHNRH